MRKIPFGKRIENNLLKSLRMAGVNLETSVELDHNHKIDFVLNLRNQEVGVQFSLRKDDMIKAKVAKICALEVVPRFIYLSLSHGFFARPDKANGKVLYQFLSRVAERYSQNALSISIDNRGPRIQSL